MTDQAISIINRLSQAGSPHPRQHWQRKNGYYVTTCCISLADVPQLIDIACKWSDPDWPQKDSDLVGNSEDIEFLPITAWRTLADLECADAVEPLIGMLYDLDDSDDWSLDDLPHVFGKIGQPAVAALVRLANDSEKQEFVREIAAAALSRVAEYHSETRKEVVGHLTEMMEKAAESDIDLNSSVLVGLVDLQADQAAEAIERAFSRNRLDVGVIGDWEDVRKVLGVEGLGLEMPKRPHNCIAQFRTRLGIGIFSEEQVFGEDGCVADAEEVYYKRAWNLFSKSKEAEQVVERCGNLGWFRSLLEFGIQYRGEVVDAMTLASVQEYIFHYAPLKISTEATSAASIILELTKFWEYVDRVYDLPAAKSIVDWLNTDDLVNHLETELADPANFGIAKSLVMAGMAAGYEMTAQQGVAEFMAAHDRSLKQSTPSRESRIGRNDPCPCGSGKKYKKCCYRVL